MNNRQIDNSHLSIKIKIREEVIHDEMNVLDCCHGEGILWSDISKRNNIHIYGIEKIKGKGSGAIYGLAEKVIPSLDLAEYQIIDCDTYGGCYKIIKKLFENKTLKKGTIVVYTYIFRALGMSNIEELGNLGFTKPMIRKCTTMFTKYGFIAFKQTLWKNGIKVIKNWEIKEKAMTNNYGYFVV